jgi:hypothetical protein
MALSSRLHGWHHVAKKSMMNGLPLFDRVSVLTVLPSMSFKVIDGSWAFAVQTQPSMITIDNKNFFILLGFTCFTLTNTQSPTDKIIHISVKNKILKQKKHF